VLADEAEVRARDEMDRRSAIDLLLRALRDPDDRVRAAAALSAGRLGDSTIGPALRAAIRDGNPGVRIHAIAGLALLALEESTPLLLRIGRGNPSTVSGRSRSKSATSPSSRSASRPAGEARIDSPSR
jgi:HEAT repeat protein